MLWSQKDLDDLQDDVLLHHEGHEVLQKEEHVQDVEHLKEPKKVHSPRSCHPLQQHEEFEKHLDPFLQTKAIATSVLEASSCASVVQWICTCSAGSTPI